MDGVPSSTRYGVLSMDGTHTTTASVGHQVSSNALSFSNPVYELSNPSAGESSIEALGQLPDLPVTPPTQEPTTPTTVAFKVGFRFSSSNEIYKDIFWFSSRWSM